MAVALCEVHRRAGGRLEVLEKRCGDLAQPGLHRREQADVPQAPADDVRAVVGALQRPGGQQASDDPQRRGRGQAAARGQPGQRQPPVALVEGAEHVEGAVDQRRTGSGATCHVRSLFH